MERRPRSARTARAAVAFALCALALVAAPVTARAATPIGQVFEPNVGGSPGVTNLQSTSPGGSYAAPADGVITGWSFQAGPNQAELPDQIKLVVGRSLGGDAFLTVGQSALEVPELDVVRAYEAQIPVKAGDVIGFWFSNTGNGASGRAPAAGYAIHYLVGDPATGTSNTFTPFAGSTQLDIAATVETTRCAGKAPTMVGTSGSDSLTGTAGPDVILALEGNDLVDGLRGADAVCGGLGKDLLRGGPGKDTLRGEGGRDTLKGGGGRDVCVGGPSRDSAGACEKQKKI